MLTKVRLKCGQVEVDCEAEEQFIKETLPQLMIELSNFIKGSGVPVTPPLPIDIGGDGNNRSKIEGTVETLAGKLNVKRGPDLILATAARLTFVQGMISFTKDQLLEEMKTAKRYCSKTILSNFNKNLRNLVKNGKLVENVTDTFTLSAATKADLESKLASS